MKKGPDFGNIDLHLRNEERETIEFRSSSV